MLVMLKIVRARDAVVYWKQPRSKKHTEEQKGVETAGRAVVDVLEEVLTNILDLQDAGKHCKKVLPERKTTYQFVNGIYPLTICH